MKQTFIKSFCLALLWCGIAMQVSAQGIVVNKLDGTKVYYKASEVQSVGVYGYGEGPDDNPELHEYVDLGLPSGTLWATCNVGANSPEEYGDYFAWGETQPMSDNIYSLSAYRYYDSVYNVYTKYCLQSHYGTIDNKSELEMSDDAATVNWGVDWQMPSIEQITELFNSSYTTTTWTTLNGKYGRKITSKSNGNSIFLPPAGFRYNTSLYKAGLIGDYWSRSLNTSNSSSASFLFFDSDSFNTNYVSRYYGLSVRPVRVKK
jgi:hypothetical protein